MRQRDVSNYRIMRSFKDSDSKLTTSEICRLSGVSRRTASPRLGKLVRQKQLQVSMARDRKTKIYQPRDLAEWQRPLLIQGSRAKRQVPRLLGLGLDVIFLPRPRGRPRTRESRHPPSDLSLIEELWNLDARITRPVIQRLATSTGMHFKQTDWPSQHGLSFSLPGRSRGKMEREIQRAISNAKEKMWQRRLHKLRNS
jgi:hypothetical protein